jgi:hypothetical protein
VSADIARIDPTLVECLQRLRDHVGKGVKINSGFRSWKRNRDIYEKRGKTPTLSQHCAGRGADIHIAGMNGLEIGKAAIDAFGPNIGVGLANTYAHIDVRGFAAAWNYGGVKDFWVTEIKRYQKGKGGSPRKPSAAGAKPRPDAAKPPAELVRFAQRVLNAAEGERLDDDGDLRRLTRDALARFRTRYGLGPGGVLDGPTELALAQRAIEELAQQSIFPQRGVLDAKTGPAIARFKSERGLGFDATIDAATRRALADALVRKTTPARPSAGAKVNDREVGETLAMAAKQVPGLGITLEELLVRHQAESGGIPIEVLLAFIHFEAGSHLFVDATSGKWSDKYQKYSPSFYELGVFQTPAGDHGCIQEGGKKMCKYEAPGHNVERSQFGKGWYRLKRTYPTKDNWRDPIMQVRIGLWDLHSTAERLIKDYGVFFPSKQSEWYLRMAVLYSFAHGAGWTRAFLSKYKNELLALPESQRWDFLRGKQAYLKSHGTKTFDPKNVDKKMALAGKLRAARGATASELMFQILQSPPLPLDALLPRRARFDMD